MNEMNSTKRCAAFRVQQTLVYSLSLSCARFALAIASVQHIHTLTHTESSGSKVTTNSNQYAQMNW